MVGSSAPTISRKQGIEIRPFHLDNVYDDPDLIIDTLKATGPHPTIQGAEGYPGADFYPTFRAYWTSSPGVPAFEDVRPVLFNPSFINAAKQAYEVEVVRPVRVVVNLAVPSPGLPAHKDFPNFRGMGSMPTWLATVMGTSGLFRRWEIQIASGLAWFYNGEGGEFRYWPDGPQNPAHSELPPFWNRGIIGDNEYTWHQVCHVGRRERYPDRSVIDVNCKLAWLEDSWNILQDGKIVQSYAPEEVRIMTLWKAHVFKNEEAAAIYDRHDDDIDHATAFKILIDDLHERGLKFAEPNDPMNDLEWRKFLFDIYAPKDTPADIEVMTA